jgi:protein-tyrosine sulfotransferase
MKAYPARTPILARRPRDIRVYDVIALTRRLLDLPSPVDNAAYDTRLASMAPVKDLQSIALAVRGEKYPPAVFVHGVMPRSGTNYVADLLKLHPRIAAYPHRLWELPLLYNTEAISQAQWEFLRTYKGNAGAVAPFEFLAYLASGLLRYLQHLAGEQRTVLLKVPHAEYLALFHAIFPRDHCVLVLRDGRDAVASHLESFGSGPLKPRISQLSNKWARAAELMLSYGKIRPQTSGQSILIRYEDANRHPTDTLRALLQSLALPETAVDFTRVATLPVRGSSALKGPNGVNWDPQVKPHDFQPVGRWHAWNDSLSRRFKRQAAETLINAGYAKDEHW